MKKRNQALQEATDGKFDVCVIGGGASGASLRARRAAARAENRDGGSGRLRFRQFHCVHQAGARRRSISAGSRHRSGHQQYHLVEAALRERGLMLRNAPYLTRTMEFLVPCFSHFDQFYYGLGMKMYDWISGKSSLLPSRMLTREEALFRMPAMQSKSLTGAVAYADGQFDDARYAVCPGGDVRRRWAAPR